MLVISEKNEVDSNRLENVTAHGAHVCTDKRENVMPLATVYCMARSKNSTAETDVGIGTSNYKNQNLKKHSDVLDTI